MNTTETSTEAAQGGFSPENGQEAMQPKEAAYTGDFTPYDIVTTARGWIGTPYHHAAALKGVGSDCTGLLIGVARELGIPVNADMNYRFGDDDLTRLEQTIKQYANEYKLSQFQDANGLQDGDILLFRGRAIFHHVAVYSKTDNTMIHVFPSAKVVSEHEFTTEWRKLLYAAYRLKGL